jgi:GDP/UDP-N,N'-diacetylbacillosamine 2-epimerase (hydrolysing)
MTRTVAVVTGTRAEYGLLRSSMEAIEDDPVLSLQTVATGMHLSPQHGYTVTEIRDDGFTVDFEVEMLLTGDSKASMARSVGIGVTGMTNALDHLDPDIVLVLGDRDEAFAAAVAAAHMTIPVAHVHGGDAMTGATIDDSIRHALTKFAHIHFPATEQSATRIERLGEEPWRITPVGAPGLDDIRADRYTDPSVIADQFGFDANRPTIIVLQHPETAATDAAGRQMQTTLDAVTSIDGDILLVYPNADAGSQAMIDEIESHPGRDRMTVVENLPRRDFLGAMAGADLMVGNSSSGIIEAPSFDLPVVNVGRRQEDRERGANVIDVGFDEAEVLTTIERCLEDDSVQKRASGGANPYDYGGTADRIVDRLREIDIDERLLQKQITY